MWNDVISLVAITHAASSLASAIAAGTATTVFAEKLSVRQSEFYQAALAGINPSTTFVVRSIEYDGQDCVLYESVPYKVIRTYDKGETTELVCERVVG